MNYQQSIRNTVSRQSATIATAEDIEAAMQYVKNTTASKLNIEVSDEKLKKVAKIYLQQKGLVVQNKDLNTEPSSSESSSERRPKRQNMWKARFKDKSQRTDWAKRIEDFKQLQKHQQTKVNEIKQHKKSLKERGLLPDISNFAKRSKSQATMVVLEAPEIFSAENYDRIVKDQQKATLQAKPQLLAKLSNPDQPPHNFFYDYKEMSISSSNLYKFGKSHEQLKEDKAVQLFFRKMLQAAKSMKKTYNKEDIRELRQVERYDDSLAGSNFDPTAELGRLINRMDGQHRVLGKIKAERAYEPSLEKQERLVERALKAQEEYVMDFISKHSLNPTKVKELMRHHKHSHSVSIPTGERKKQREKALDEHEQRTMDQLFEMANQAKLQRKEQKRLLRLRNEENPILTTVHENMRHNLVGKKQRKRGGIIYKSSTIAHMIELFDAQYSSTDSDDCGIETKRKVNSMVRTNIKQETAGDKIETMLAMNTIKVSDVNWQKRKKDQLRTSKKLSNIVPVAGRHVKNSASQPNLKTDIAFIAATPTESERKKVETQFSKGLENGSVTERRKLSVNITPISKALASIPKQNSYGKKLYVQGKKRSNSKSQIDLQKTLERPSVDGSTLLQLGGQGSFQIPIKKKHFPTAAASGHITAADSKPVTAKESAIRQPLEKHAEAGTNMSQSIDTQCFEEASDNNLAIRAQKEQIAVSAVTLEPNEEADTVLLLDPENPKFTEIILSTDLILPGPQLVQGRNTVVEKGQKAGQKSLASNLKTSRTSIGEQSLQNSSNSNYRLNKLTRQRTKLEKSFAAVQENEVTQQSVEQLHNMVSAMGKGQNKKFLLNVLPSKRGKS